MCHLRKMMMSKFCGIQENFFKVACHWICTSCYIFLGENLASHTQNSATGKAQQDHIFTMLAA